jgi:hypothetical protein
MLSSYDLVDSNVNLIQLLVLMTPKLKPLHLLRFVTIDIGYKFVIIAYITSIY